MIESSWNSEVVIFHDYYWWSILEENCTELNQNLTWLKGSKKHGFPEIFVRKYPYRLEWCYCVTPIGDDKKTKKIQCLFQVRPFYLVSYFYLGSTADNSIILREEYMTFPMCTFLLAALSGSRTACDVSSFYIFSKFHHPYCALIGFCRIFSIQKFKIISVNNFSKLLQLCIIRVQNEPKCDWLFHL